MRRMSTAGLPTIWELLAEAAETLPEPFSRAALINWVSARRPDVGIASIAAHIQFATDNAAHARANPFAERIPLLHRVDRGQYRRYRAPAPEWQGIAGGPTPGRRVLLLASSGATGATARPAAQLFESAGFVQARDRAVRSGLPWFVLSAKHGVLDPDDVIGPYEVELGDRSAAYRNAWAEWVVAQLGDRVALDGVTVEVHGGVDFVQPLRRPLAERGAAVELPLPEAWRDVEPPAVPDDVGAGSALGRFRDLVSRHRPGSGGGGSARGFGAAS